MTLYRGTVTLADCDRDHHAVVEPATLHHPSETTERLVLRLLAWVLLHQPGLAARPGRVSEGEAPELAVQDPDGRIIHWIEVGTPDEKRLRKAAGRSDAVTVVTHEALLGRWRRRLGGRDPAFGGELLVVETPLVEALARSLPRTFRWQATISGETLYLDDGATTHTSALRRLAC